MHDFGTTDAEMHDGEPLLARLEREEPDVLSQRLLGQDAVPGHPATQGALEEAVLALLRAPVQQRLAG